MITAIADTHTAIWYLFSDERLGRSASAFIDATIAYGDHIGISAISLAEMVYLIEKERIAPTALDDVLAAITDPKNVLKQIALDDRIAINMRNIPRQDIPDLPDRIIAATALLYGVPVLSRMDVSAPPASRQSGDLEQLSGVDRFAFAATLAFLQNPTMSFSILAPKPSLGRLNLLRMSIWSTRIWSTRCNHSLPLFRVPKYGRGEGTLGATPRCQ